MLKRLVGILAAALLGFSVTACSSLPESMRNEAKQLDKSINGLETILKQREVEFAATKKSKEWAFYGPYATRENWGNRFVLAKQSIAKLRVSYDTHIEPIMDRNEPKDAAVLTKNLQVATTDYRAVLGQVNYVKNRTQLIATGRSKAPAWQAETAKRATAIAATAVALQPVITRAKSDFPTRAGDIDKRYVPIRRMAQETEAAKTVFESEFAKHTANSGADYAKLADAYTLIGRHADAVAKQDTSYRAQLASLSREYSLVLQDMKIEYEVTIGRSSWDESSDWGEQDTTYQPTRISKADYDTLAALPEEETLATRSSGWSSWSESVNIDSGLWSRLGIDMAANWPDSSHNSSTFYIQELTPIYFHKYTEVTGRISTTRDWQQVDDEEFGENADNFGMALRTKKLGQFEDEVLDQPTPIGMDMVGDPRYGNWVSDGNGGQRWSFLEMYAVYALLTGNNGIYSRSDYDSYRRWREEDRRSSAGPYGWYGASSTQPTYGSRGSRTASSAQYRSSPFAKVGGVNAVPSDVRAAGGRTRSRGPGSRGK